MMCPADESKVKVRAIWRAKGRKSGATHDVRPEPSVRIDESVIIRWILTLVTAGIGIYQYADQRAQTDPTKWRTSQKNFWRLYWGPLGIVEAAASKPPSCGSVKSCPGNHQRRLCR